jgi:hypothetical protein
MLVETKTYNEDDGSVGYIESVFESSNILKATFFPKKERLYLSFTSGDTYSYGNVNNELYERFMSSDSQGKFFIQNIKKETDKYPYRKEFKLKQYELDEINEVINTHKEKCHG